MGIDYCPPSRDGALGAYGGGPSSMSISVPKIVPGPKDPPADGDTGDEGRGIFECSDSGDSASGSTRPSSFCTYRSTLPFRARPAGWPPEPEPEPAMVVGSCEDAPAGDCGD